MLDALGVRQGRTGYWWRRHGYEEPGLLSWVPGRPDHVPETLIKSEQRLEEGTWPQNGAQEIQVNLERTDTMSLRVWLSVVSDTSINPLLMRGENLLQRPGNRIIVSWRPEEAAARLGLAMCRDAAQSQCHVLLLFGFNGRLGFAFKRHSFQEAGASGWVAGRNDRMPATVLRSDPGVEGWPLGGRQPLQIVVDRSVPGGVQVWVEGGETLSLQLPDQYSHFTVSSLDEHGGTAEVEGAPAHPQQQQPDLSFGQGDCVPSIRGHMARGQQMLLVWEPRASHGNLGVSFCVDASQGDCFVLDMYGFRDRRLAYSWRHHSALEAGVGAWVPGRDTLVPENHLQTDAEVEPGWPGNPSQFLMMVTVTAAGVVELRVDGLDPGQTRRLKFSLPEGHTSMAVSSPQHTGEYSIRGPCFNGFKYKWSSLLCNIPDAASLAVEQSELQSAWTLKARSAHGQMRSPAMSGDDGEICISMEVLTVGSARLTITVEDIEGNAQPVRLAEVVPQDTSKGEWQRLQKTTTLPEAMRRSQVRVVVAGDQVDGSGLVLVKTLSFCNPHTCGVAPQNVVPLIAHGSVAKIGDYPWFAGIFSRDGDSWDSICGGTLVRPDVVVSAAHCFFDESSWKTYDQDRFRVSVGKYTRDWNVQEAGEQRSAVLGIIIPDRYRGSKRIYEHDIAFLRVRFVVTALVLPICVDFKDQFSLKAGDVGVVNGWGLTENKATSPKLQFAKMPYIPFNECIKSVPDSLARYLTGDKFCAGNINGSTVWSGDSGGGLSFAKNGRWFLHGIVSAGVPGKLTYSLFTDMHRYLDLLKKVLSS
ncbi:uncharacterized protein LOC117644788 [Thrips palmi]|uniref:Uncharacterized protein LOC117644788 n=1 Tax=Thrips palmi TaxID=161013 RepID=A0A6P8YKA1_THRPL|nr:uncharacterized protein LOC117644788 [Thrips palmi]